VEGQLLVVATDSLSVLPLKRALTSFSLRDLPAVRTGVELRFDYQRERALLTMLLGPVLDRPLARRLRLLLADLEAAATGRSR
jgi:hypothetical protein